MSTARAIGVVVRAACVMTCDVCIGGLRRPPICPVLLLFTLVNPENRALALGKTTHQSGTAGRGLAAALGTDPTF